PRVSVVVLALARPQSLLHSQQNLMLSPSLWSRSPSSLKDGDACIRPNKVCENCANVSIQSSPFPTKDFCTLLRKAHRSLTRSEWQTTCSVRQYRESVI